MDLYFPEQHVDQIVDALNKFTSDTSEHKINCTFGILNDAYGDLYKFRCIKKAEKMLLIEDLSYLYLSSIGNEKYIKLSTELYFGSNTHYYGVQTIGGTGSLYLAGQFINVTFKNLGKNIWIPNSTWDTHIHIFQNHGIEVKRYIYLENNEFNFSTMYESICSIPDYNIVLFHGCCHNPTGYDLIQHNGTKLLNYAS
jgi:aspartate aminotransferase/aromatic-amino-acid transaminase